MRVSVAALAALAAAPLSQAAYSQGWQPGKPVTKYLTSTSTAASALPTSVSEKLPSKPWSFKDAKLPGLEDLLTTQPVANFLGKFGFNVSAQLELAREGIPAKYNLEIPLVTDENYESLIYNETYSSAQQQRDRVWAILVTIGSKDPVSSFYDRVYDEAHNLTVKAADLPNVKWGRVDYLEVTEITTRWVIWRAPVLVIATDNGQDLRFFKANFLKTIQTPEEMRSFIKTGAWKSYPPWDTIWSPRGPRGPWLKTISKYSAILYSWLNVMPRWLLLLITGTIASTLTNFLHSAVETKEEKKEREEERRMVESGETPEWAKDQEAEHQAKKRKASTTATASGAEASPSKAGAKKRKGKK